MLRKNVGAWVNGVVTVEVEGVRSGGRTRFNWGQVGEKDTKECCLARKDAKDCAQGRRMSQGATIQPLHNHGIQP